MAFHPSTLLDVPTLRDLTPAILAAWDDDFLTPAELLAIRDELERTPGLDQPAKDTLRTWLNPELPPSAEGLSALQRAWSAGSQRAGSDGALRAVLAVLEPPYSVKRALKARGAELGTSHPSIPKWRALLDGEQHAIRDSVRALLQDERFRSSRELDMAAYREQVLAFIRALSALPVVRDLLPHPPGPSIAQFCAAFETIALFDMSVVVKFGVQFCLFASAIQQLGTEQHHELLPKVASCELIGCFAMTERAHGSNVRGLETIGRYEP
ncbi:MAG TPA: acyl-CoA dehydrogenase family protein, partial [Polyangiales bacterium]